MPDAVNAGPIRSSVASGAPGPVPDAPAYNYEHFRAVQIRDEVRRLLAGASIPPGEPAPDFDLPRAGGGSVRLGDLRGKPVLFHFASPT